MPFRYTPTVSVPLPSQSPTAGRSPASPNENAMSAGPVVAELRRKNVPARYTPGESLPSPFQSPQTGVSNTPPKVKERTPPEPSWAVMYQTPCRKIPGVSTPSPFQSHASTRSPPVPRLNCESAMPVVSALRRNHVGVGGGGGG